MKIYNTIKTYAEKLSPEDLEFLYLRLTERVGDDISEALTFVSTNKELDSWLGQSLDGENLFDNLDLLTQCVEREMMKRIAPNDYREFTISRGDMGVKG